MRISPVAAEGLPSVTYSIFEDAKLRPRTKQCYSKRNDERVRYVAGPRNQFGLLEAGPRRPAFSFFSLCRGFPANHISAAVSAQ